MFLRSSQDEKNLAALNAPQRSLAVIGKCVAILALSIAGVVVIGGDRHVFGPPLIALLLTALVAIVLVSLRPRLFLAPFSVLEKDNLPDRAALDSTQALFMAMPLPSLLVDCESRQVIAANPAAAELYGYAVESLPGLPMNALWSSERREETVTESQLDGLAKHQRADGSVFWAETRLKRLDHQARPAWLLAVSDASARMNLAERLDSSDRFAEDLAELSLGIVFIHDLDGILHSVNSAFSRALGYSADELIGQNLYGLLVPREHDAVRGTLENIHHDEGGFGIVHLKRRDGSQLACEFRSRLCIADDDSRLVHCCAIDISERSRNERRLLKTSRKDMLTGCYNWQHLQIFEDDVEPGAPWAAIVIDTIQSNRCNESNGYRLGDPILVATARLLDSMVRNEDSVVHLGGYAFAILLRRSDHATLESLAVRLQRARDTAPDTPFTFGMASRKDGEALEETVRRADRQLIERRFLERISLRIEPSGGARPRAVRNQLHSIQDEVGGNLLPMHSTYTSSGPNCRTASGKSSESLACDDWGGDQNC